MQSLKHKSPVSKNYMPTLLDRMIRRITREGHLSGFTDEQLLSVLQEAKTSLEPLPAMLEIDAPVVIFGDVHGQLRDLLRFFSIIGPPPKNKILFLGDYVDRCKKSLEVIMLLLCYRIKYPDLIHLLRGNHECSKMNRLYGFYEELRRKRNVYMWKKFQEVFNEMPLCAVVSNRILCMHGGISPEIHGWDSLQTLKKPKTPRACDDGIAVDLMWSDPSMDSCTGFQFNAIRATSYIFGGDTIANICQLLDIAMVVRAHEVVKGGHQFMFDRKLLTIFSAPNYCGTDGNAASVMKVSRRMEVSFVTLKPRLDTSRLSEEKRLLLEKMSLEINAKSPDPCARPSSTPENAKKTLNNDDCLVGPGNGNGNKQTAVKAYSDHQRTVEFMPLVVTGGMNRPRDELSTASDETQKSLTVSPTTAALAVPLVRPKNAQKGLTSKPLDIVGGEIPLEAIQKPHKSLGSPTSKTSSPKKREISALPLNISNDDANDEESDKVPSSKPTTSGASKASTKFAMKTSLRHPQKVQQVKQASTETDSSSISTISERTVATAKPLSPATAKIFSPGGPRSVEEAAKVAIAATKIPHHSHSKDSKQMIIATEKALQKP